MSSTVHQRLTSALALALGLSICACNGGQKPEERQIFERPAGALRSIEATEGLAVDELAASLSLSISSMYKEWSKDASPKIDVEIKNNTQKYASAITLPVFSVYDVGSNKVLAYARLDLATGFALASRRTTVISIPIGSEKTLSSPIKRLEWFAPEAPEQPQALHSLLKAGHYEVKLEISIFNHDDVEVSKLKSEPLSFELIQ